MILSIMKEVAYKSIRYVGPQLIKSIDKHCSTNIKYRARKMYLSVIARDEIKYDSSECNYQSSKLQLTLCKS